MSSPTLPVLDLLHTAHHDGADVKIIYHAREVESMVTDKNGKTTLTQAGVNRQAVKDAQIADLRLERQAN